MLPEGMSLDYGAMIEPVAVAAHATMRGGDLKGKNVVVSGAGTIGNPWRSSLRQEEPNGFLLPM